MEPRDRTTGLHDPIDPAQSGRRPGEELRDDPKILDAVRRKIAEHPQAAPDDIVAMLAEEHIQVSATIVFQQMQARK